MFILPVNYRRLELVQTHPLPLSRHALLCQSNFLSRRYNSESMRRCLKSAHFLQLLLLCGYSSAVWGWNKFSLQSIRFTTSLEPLPCFILPLSFLLCCQVQTILQPSATFLHTFSDFVFQSHLLSLLSHHTGLCANCATQTSPPKLLPPHNWASLSAT